MRIANAELAYYSGAARVMQAGTHSKWRGQQPRRLDTIWPLVWKAMTGTAPDYISELCLPVGTQTGRRALRSASRNDLIVPSFRTTSRARRDFSIVASRIWNTLPPSLRATNAACGYLVFSRLLMTHFFSCLITC